MSSAVHHQAPETSTQAPSVARYTVVGTARAGLVDTAPPAALTEDSALSSVPAQLREAAFHDVLHRAPGMLLVLAVVQVIFAVWEGGLQGQPWVLICAVMALLWLTLCAHTQRLLRQAYARGRTRIATPLHTRWQRQMGVALLLPALTVSLHVALVGKADLEAIVAQVLVCLYAGAVWAALPVLALQGVTSALISASVCALHGDTRLSVALVGAAVMTWWLQRQVKAVWLHATRARIQADTLSAQLTRERDAAVRAQQDATRFVATASHDLRQPMHALGLFVSTLDRRLKDQPEGFLVRNMVRSIESLDQSFGAMLDMSKLDAGSLTPNLQVFALRDVFRRLHLHFAGTAEATHLSLRFSPGGKSVRSDPQLLERVLANLIQNALRHTRRGGVVVVARSTRHHLNLEVWDTGNGIAASELPRIFDEFYQVRDGEGQRQRGLGLGLAIVKRLVQLMGHTLSVTSCPGRGTLFRIGIATSEFDAVEHATAAAETLPMPVYNARTILVVDDEDSIREGLRVVLSEWGYEVLVAATGDEAVQCCADAHGLVDLILSDLHLAEGEDGLAVVERIRQACGHEVAAVVITGDTTAVEMHRVTDAGLALLFKPVQPRRLLSVLRRMTH